MRSVKEIKADISSLKKEMKESGIRVTSFMNRQPSIQAARANERLFALKCELEKCFEWDIGKVKTELPEIQVSIYGDIKIAKMSGRMQDFATVSVEAGTGNWCSWEVAWSTVVRCLNEGRPIKIAT